MALYAIGDLHLSLNSNKSMEVFGPAWENYTERIRASLSQLTAEDVLEVLAGKLEDRETSLEDSFRLYKQGMELLKYCNDKLDTVEKKMLQMNEDGSLGEFSR